MKLEQKILTYRRNHTLKQTGIKFNLTSERIRQIEFTKDRKRCKVHNRFYYNKCSHCFVMGYKKIIWKMSDAAVEYEIEKEALNFKRDYLSVQKRVYLIEILFKKYKNSISEIARKLNRDRSTINHLLKRYIKTTFL